MPYSSQLFTTNRTNMVLDKRVIWIITLLNCKKGGNGMEPFIVGGDFTTIDYFPHSVYLSVDCNTQWICGSSIINQKTLLTAAHCLHGCIRKFSIDAYAGNSNLNKVQVIRKVHRIVIHELYDEITVYCDIGMGMLNADLPLGYYIKRVLLSANFPVGSLNSQVAGWGTVNDATGKGTVDLKVVRQKLRSTQTCSIIGELYDGMMCAGSSKKKTTNHPSEGDSGSALITSKFIQIGLVSFRCESHPGLIMYTNVTYFYPWIQSSIRALWCTKRKG